MPASRQVCGTAVVRPSTEETPEAPEWHKNNRTESVPIIQGAPTARRGAVVAFFLRVAGAARACSAVCMVKCSAS